MTREVALELLLGRRVHDAQGAVVGRLEEIRAEWRDTRVYVTEYLIGPAALLERLAIRWLPILRIPHERFRMGYVAEWHQLDISNPRQPRLRGLRDQLKRVRF
jgi:sporulation protein YlmC with PRC-barrel domain